MTAIGCIVLVVGVVVSFAGGLRFLVIAYRRSLWWFFGCLFVPFVDTIFFILNFKATIKPVCLEFLGLLLVVLGSYLAGVDWPNHAP